MTVNLTCYKIMLSLCLSWVHFRGISKLTLKLSPELLMICYMIGLVSVNIFVSVIRDASIQLWRLASGSTLMWQVGLVFDAFPSQFTDIFNIVWSWMTRHKSCLGQGTKSLNSTAVIPAMLCKCISACDHCLLGV